MCMELLKRGFLSIDAATDMIVYVSEVEGRVQSTLS